MREDSIALFLEGDQNRAALQYQRLNKRDRERTFWVKTVEEAVDILKNYKKRLDIVSFGYNLTRDICPHPSNPNCGMEVIRWLEKQPSQDYSHVRFIVHAWENAGKKMTDRLRVKGYRVIYIPFGL